MYYLPAHQTDRCTIDNEAGKTTIDTGVQALTGTGPLGVRELARRVDRDVKGVHTDVNALVTAGIVDRTENGKYLFPFDQVKVQFELHAAA